jgi:sugar/nucleoside kinase (ribokinase family)
MSGARYTSLGNVSIDDLVLADSTTMWCVPGGNSIYSALGMAVWQERPQVIAPIGPEYPTAILAGRVDLSHCRPIERTLRNWGLYEEDGTRHFIFRSTTRNWVDFSPRPADLGEGPYGCCHLSPLPFALQIEFTEALRLRGAGLISLDPDDRHLASVERSDLAKLMRLVDLFLPSRQEVRSLFGDVAPIEALRALRDIAPEVPVIGVKCGAAGAIAHARGAKEYIAVPAVLDAVVDTTGAGDAFCGGALVGYSRTTDTAQALLHGAVSASFAVAARGPTALIEADPEIAQARLRQLSGRLERRPF